MSKPTRDRTRFHYFTIGIARGSQLMKRIEQDAGNMGTQRITHVILARLNDYYELIDKIESGIFFTRNQDPGPQEPDSDNSVDNATLAAQVWEDEE